MKKNNCTKILSIISLICLLASFPFRQASAAPYHMDINFTDNLHLTDNGVLLFHEESVVPGDELTNPISVTNNSSFEEVYFGIKSISNDNASFNDIIQYQIFDSSDNLVYDAASGSEQELAVLGVGDSADYTIKMLISPKAENDIQHQTVNIQFAFYVYTFETVPDTGAMQQKATDLSSEENYLFIIILIIALIFLIFFIIKKRNNKKAPQNAKKAPQSGKKKPQGNKGKQRKGIKK